MLGSRITISGTGPVLVICQTGMYQLVPVYRHMLHQYISVFWRGRKKGEVEGAVEEQRRKNENEGRRKKRKQW